MNDMIRLMVERRSTRKFKPDQITDDQLEQILLAGLHAPSASNNQGVFFVVVQDKDVREKVVKMNLSYMNSTKLADPYYGAPTLILVLSRGTIAPVEDGSLAIGNMYNACEALGLGSCWIHREKQMFESQEGKDLLKAYGIEGDYIGIGSLAVGYPDCEKAPVKELKEDRVYRI